MPSSPFFSFHPRTVALSLVIALVVVLLFALGMKQLVEGLTSFTYTIHWFETVPFLVLAVAFAVNGWLNERAGGAGE